MIVPGAAVFLLVQGAAAGLPSPQGCTANVATMHADAFVACARAGTDKYRDQNAAVLDGYRRIGRDFPAMGEHWIRASLVFDGRFEPSRPEVLNYVLVDGKPQLLGVGYAVPLLPGEHAPAAPGGPTAWHDHSRTIDDETVLPHHDSHGRAEAVARLSMLHAWIWSPNHDGMFAADNWAIPFVRLKLLPIATVPAVGKALSLATGARDYFERAIAAAVSPSSTHTTRVRAAMDHAVWRVEAIVNRVSGQALSDADCKDLAAAWSRLWNSIDAALPPEAKEKLEHLPIR